MPTSRFEPVLHGARPTVPLLAAKVAEGQHFTTPHNVSVGTVTAVTVLVTAPATGTYHLIGQVQADKAGTWTFSKAPNTSGGTALTTANNNQNSSNTGGLTITHTATFVSVGTVLVNGLVGADSGPMSIAADDRDGSSEWILAANQLYLVRFVAGAAATNVIVTLRHWKET